MADIMTAAALAAAALDPIEHHVRVNHANGVIEAHYRASVAIVHDQQGTPAPGGRASSLRCAWRATITIDRNARLRGSSMTRSVVRDGAIQGSRPGWCVGQHRAIMRQVAQRNARLRAELLAAAAQDRATLLAEADRLDAGRRDS